MRFIVTALLVLLSCPAAAQADEYNAYYGDGIRAYTESRYDEALTHLYRAMAVRPTPFAMKLIIRVHDFQGNCSARNNAITMLSDLFPRESAPRAQLCTNVGELLISCGSDEESARVDQQFDAPCGTAILVPTGVHMVENARLGIRVSVEVRRGHRAEAALMLRPNKWYLDERHRQVVELPERWLRPGLLVDPDMPRTFQWKQPRR